MQKPTTHVGRVDSRMKKDALPAPSTSGSMRPAHCELRVRICGAMNKDEDTRVGKDPREPNKGEDDKNEDSGTEAAPE